MGDGHEGYEPDEMDEDGRQMVDDEDYWRELARWEEWRGLKNHGLTTLRYADWCEEQERPKI